jgi:hypothetical protein
VKLRFLRIKIIKDPPRFAEKTLFLQKNHHTLINKYKKETPIAGASCSALST